MALLRRQRTQARMIIGGARHGDVGLAALHHQREVARTLGGVLVLVQTGQAQHRPPRRRLLVVWQIERLAAPAELGRKRAAERTPLRTILLRERNMLEPVLWD